MLKSCYDGHRIPAITLRFGSIHLGYVIVYGISFLFLGAAIGKAFFPIEFFNNLLAYHLDTNRSILLYGSMFMIILEAYLGLSLLSAKHQTRLLIISSTALIFFIYLLVRSNQWGDLKDCGCFGAIAHVSPLNTIMKNLIFLFLIILIFILRLFKTNKKKIEEDIDATKIKDIFGTLGIGIIIGFSSPLNLTLHSENFVILLFSISLGILICLSTIILSRTNPVYGLLNSLFGIILGVLINIAYLPGSEFISQIMQTMAMTGLIVLIFSSLKRTVCWPIKLGSIILVICLGLAIPASDLLLEFNYITPFLVAMIFIGLIIVFWPISLNSVNTTSNTIFWSIIITFVVISSFVYPISSWISPPSLLNPSIINNKWPGPSSIQNFNISDSDEPIVLYLFDVNCSHCVKVAPKVEEIRSRFPELEILGICSNRESDIKDYKNRTGLDLKIYSDNPIEFRSYAATPLLVLVDNDTVRTVFYQDDITVNSFINRFFKLYPEPKINTNE